MFVNIIRRACWVALFVLSSNTARAAAQVKPLLESPIEKIPGKSMVVLEVNYAAGAKSSSHRHPAAAFIYAYVVSGAIRSQVEGQPARIFKAGEGFAELPGQHHLVSENASASSPAKMLVVFVIDAADQPLSKDD